MNNYFKAFLNQASTKKLIEVGRTFGQPRTGSWTYMSGLAYNMRVYNRALSDSEIHDNFVTSKNFHQSLLTEDIE